MKHDNLKERTRQFALAVIRLVEGLPRTRTAEVIGRQLLRCATSVGANYRAACRARSRADLSAKMGLVEEEVDEPAYWLSLLGDAGIPFREQAEPLTDEADQLVAIVVSSINTARRNKNAQ